MASWASQGHGLRRREGNPSNHLESAGKSMARSHQTSDEAASAAGAVNAPRIPVTSAHALQGTLVPKKNTQAADPYAGGKANRKNIEKVGASYRIQPKIGAGVVDPAVGPTMANARTVPSVAGRANPNFQGGIQASSL